jgi:site-specific recombinase XerD
MTQLNEAVETYMYVISSLSEHTIISYRDKLQVFVNFCEQEKVDLDKITPKVFRRFMDLYIACKNEETSQLVTRDTAILSLLLDTGIRATELCTLTLDHVHLDPQDSYILVLVDV